MNNKPSFGNFIQQNILMGEIYTNNKTNKMYVEKNATKLRVIGEVIICTLPIVNLFICSILIGLGQFKYIFLDIDIIMAVIVFIIYLLRFFFVEFDEYKTGQNEPQERKTVEKLLLSSFWILKLITRPIILFLIL